MEKTKHTPKPPKMLGKAIKTQVASEQRKNSWICGSKLSQLAVPLQAPSFVPPPMPEIGDEPLDGNCTVHNCTVLGCIF